jgi:hypothetical protein
VAALPAPPPTPPRFAGLPDLPALATLCARPQWVCWTPRLVDGRWTKPPLIARNGFGASHSKPSDWTTYEEAAAAAIRRGWAGVGYVVTADDGLTGADLDHCRDPATGELDDWAADIVALAETYIEVSPSGSGLRIIWSGKIDATIKADPVHVEVYRDRRFLTITGNHLPGTPDAICPAPLTAAALVARVAAFREERDAARAALPVSAPAGRVRAVAPGRGGEFFRRVNSAALAALASWVPALFGAAARYQKGTGAYRVSSQALARGLEEDLSLSPAGIVDWGVADMGDARDGKRTPVDVVLEFARLPSPTARAAAEWLCDRLGRTPADMGWEDAGMGGDPAHGAALAAALAAGPRDHDPETGEVWDAPPGPAGAVDFTIPGLGGAITDFVFATAPRPSREFAFLPAMGLLSVLFGRRFLSPLGMPLNLYLAGIGASGYGKDHALKAVRNLLHEAGLEHLLGPSDFSSDSAIELVLRAKPCCIANIDEFGVFLQGVSSKYSGGHERRIRKALLDLYPLGTSPWSGKATADREKATAAVWYPTFSLLGFSTPTEFFDGLDERNLKDGFLARPVFVSLDRRPALVPPPPFVGPPRLLALLRAAMSWAPAGNLSGAATRQSTMRPPLVSVPFADDPARRAFGDFAAWQDHAMDAAPDTDGLVNRAAENALRMATLRALSRVVTDPAVRPDLGAAAVTREDVEWAAAIVRQSLAMLDAGIRAFMAGSDFERAHKVALAAIVATGGDGLPDSLLRRVKGMSKLDERTFKQVIEYLVRADLIYAREPRRAGRRGIRYFGVEFQPGEGVA